MSRHPANITRIELRRESYLRGYTYYFSQLLTSQWNHQKIDQATREDDARPRQIAIASWQPSQKCPFAPGSGPGQALSPSTAIGINFVPVRPERISFIPVRPERRSEATESRDEWERSRRGSRNDR